MDRFSWGPLPSTPEALAAQASEGRWPRICEKVGAGRASGEVVR